VANAWDGVTLPTATAYAAAAPTASGKIWVMGGFTGSTQGTQQRLVQEYDPVEGTCTQQRQLVRPRGGAAGINYGGQVYCLRGTKYAPSPFSSAVYDAYADGEWYNLARGYWMPSIMNYLGIFVAPPTVLDRKGLYTPSPGKYLDKIFLLGGVTDQMITNSATRTRFGLPPGQHRRRYHADSHSAAIPGISVRIKAHSHGDRRAYSLEMLSLKKLLSYNESQNRKRSLTM
jgi:hypothetical protein